MYAFVIAYKMNEMIRLVCEAAWMIVYIVLA